jgi:acetylornithine deacetylase/succinyl-diaminopimelate desuccinylase-like protein
VFAPTCNISGMWAGHTAEGSKTVIPSSAHARLDFRLPPGLTPPQCLDALKTHLLRRGFTDIDVKQVGRGLEAGCSDPAHPFIQLTVDVLRMHYEAEPLVSPMHGGTGPAAHVVHHLGIPFASIGCSYPGSRKHAPDENIRLEDFVRGAGAIADVLDRYAFLSTASSNTVSI